MSDNTNSENSENIKELVCEDFRAWQNEKSSDKCLVISFEGKIGNNNSYEINRKIHQLFSSDKINCVLDLENLEYMNSTGVAILFSLFFRIKESGYKFLIGDLHPFLKRIFSLMDFPEGLEIVGHTQDAIDQINES